MSESHPLSAQRRSAAGAVRQRLLGAVYMAITGLNVRGRLDLDRRFPAPRTENTLDCALLEGELASELLAALREQSLPELAAEIAWAESAHRGGVHKADLKRCAPIWSWCRATLPCCMR